MTRFQAYIPVVSPTDVLNSSQRRLFLEQVLPFLMRFISLEWAAHNHLMLSELPQYFVPFFVALITYFF